ncbi:MAG: NAD(P)H-dependent oxidoreductase [Acidobacteriota bacterium]|jgi:putative NADPH-quinone reductase|nr:NAD(P)H-dependent oxidoreductase [Acidobacteriota bacterium]
METNRRHFMKAAASATAVLGAAAVAAQSFAAQSSGTSGAAAGNKKTVILLAHPSYDKSAANKALIESAKSVPGVEVIDIYAAPLKDETYRAALTQASTVVFQFPFRWFSAPAKLKEWCDELLMGYAGMGGSGLLKGKKLLVAVTAGYAEDSYRSGGQSQFTVDELLRPLQVLAISSAMSWQTPFVIYGAMGASPSVKVGAAAYKDRLAAL